MTIPTSALTLSLTLTLCASCRRASVAAVDAAIPAAHDAPLPVGPRTQPAMAPWCFTPMPTADLRAIDSDGTVWSVRAGHLFDETHRAVSVLPTERPCPAPGAWAMEFLSDGRAFAVLDSRFYVRRDRQSGFRVTPMCTDLTGAPFAPRAEGGFSFAVHTWASTGPGLMLTNDPLGASGWYAITALDRTLTAAVLDPHHSLLSLANGGHLIVVDQEQHVAGEVLATHGALFQGVSRTPAGVVAWRDEADDTRTLVLSESVVGPYADVRSSRSPHSTTRGVFRADLARLVAVTSRGIEVSTDRGEHFQEVIVSETSFERPVTGWLQSHQIAVASRHGIASPRCLDAPTDRDR